MSASAVTAHRQEKLFNHSPTAFTQVWSVLLCRVVKMDGLLLASVEATGLMNCCDADWLQIWAANTHLTNPHDFKLYQLVNLGAMYPAREADTLADLAHRFRSDLRSLRVSASPFVFASLPHLPPSFALPFLPGNLRICD